MTTLHDSAFREWQSALNGQRMHHGWILSGRSGLGKMDFAQNAARQYVAIGCEGQPTGDHPDIHLLARLPANEKEAAKRDEGKEYTRKRNISVAQIREMQARLTTRPTLGERRAILINPADDLEKGAANALLKSLEEPPKGTIFLLVNHRPGRLLPTIRSRCRGLRFEALSVPQMERVLAEKCPDVDPSNRKLAVAAAGGSPGVAKGFLEQDLGKIFAIFSRIIDQGDSDLADRDGLMRAMGPRPSLDRQLAALELARSALAARVGQVGLAEIPALAEAYNALDRLSAQAPTYNFDAGLLAAEIGGLLGSAAAHREPAHG